MSEHVSLLKDLKAGKNCSAEAAVAIEYLEAALDSANQRAEDFKALADESVQVIETLKASLADKETVIQEYEVDLAARDGELESLRERLRDNETAINTILRWCRGNIEIPCEITPFCIQVRDLIEAIPTESPDTESELEILKTYIFSDRDRADEYADWLKNREAESPDTAKHCEPGVWCDYHCRSPEQCVHKNHATGSFPDTGEG